MEGIMPNSVSDTQFVEPDANEDESTTLFQTPLVDTELVERLTAQAMIDHGFFVRNKEDQQVADVKPLRAAVLAAMENNHVVHSNKELTAGAVTKFELYAELFPNGPGIASLPTSLEEEAAQKELTKTVWSLTNTGPTGHVQHNISHSGLILCEAQIARTKISQETGKKQPTTEMGRFLTGDAQLILTHYTGPAGAAFVKQARALEKKLGMVATRQPELTQAVARQIQAVVKQAQAAIPHADPKQASALNAGVSDETAAPEAAGA